MGEREGRGLADSSTVAAAEAVGVRVGCQGVAAAVGGALALGLTLLTTMLPALMLMVTGAVPVTNPSCVLHRALLLLGGHTEPLPRGTPRKRASVMLEARPAQPPL